MVDGQMTQKGTSEANLLTRARTEAASEITDFSLWISFTFLSDADIGSSSCACKAWVSAGSSDNVWNFKCDALWKGKVFVPEELTRLRALGVGNRSREAYIKSLADRTRSALTPQELSGFAWSFRFKAQAGEAWVRGDPYWRGQPARRCRFNKDSTAVFGPFQRREERPRLLSGHRRHRGGVRGVVLKLGGVGEWCEGSENDDVDDTSAGVPEKETTTSIAEPDQYEPEALKKGIILDCGGATAVLTANDFAHSAAAATDAIGGGGGANDDDDDGSGGADAAGSGGGGALMGSMTWRFVGGSAGQRGPLGSFVRMKVDGREVPTYLVTRNPLNWGFVMQSCWALLTSWEMPVRDMSASASTTQPTRPQQQQSTQRHGVEIQITSSSTSSSSSSSPSSTSSSPSLTSSSLWSSPSSSSSSLLSVSGTGTGTGGHDIGDDSSSSSRKGVKSLESAVMPFHHRHPCRISTPPQLGLNEQQLQRRRHGGDDYDDGGYKRSGGGGAEEERVSVGESGAEGGEDDGRYEREGGVRGRGDSDEYDDDGGDSLETELGISDVSVRAQWAEALGYNRGFAVDDLGAVFTRLPPLPYTPLPPTSALESVQGVGQGGHSGEENHDYDENDGDEEEDYDDDDGNGVVSDHGNDCDCDCEDFEDDTDYDDWDSENDGEDDHEEESKKGHGRHTRSDKGGSDGSTSFESLPSICFTTEEERGGQRDCRTCKRTQGGVGNHWCTDNLNKFFAACKATTTASADAVQGNNQPL